METFKVQDGYSRTKASRMITVRRMTLNEVMALGYGDHVQFISLDGKLRNIKVNGKVRRWKREPDRFELPLKYGMYEYATFTNADLPRLVVEVLEDSDHAS